MEFPRHGEATNEASWLVGHGEMARLIRDKDWSRTPLGPLGTWSPELRLAVNMLLSLGLPSVLIWGAHRVTLYNDAYRRLASARHPHLLGQDVREGLARIWPDIRAHFEDALAGGTALLENLRLFTDRAGRIEEAFYSLSFSPLRDARGQVVAVWISGMENTTVIHNERRSRLLRELTQELLSARSEEEVFTRATRTLGAHAMDVPFALFYLKDPQDGVWRRVAGTGLAETPETGPERWPLEEALRGGQALEVSPREGAWGPLTCAPYPEPLQAARVQPLRMYGPFLAVMVTGLGPRLRANSAYGFFLEGLAETLNQALAQVRSRLSEARLGGAAHVHLERLRQLFHGVPVAIAIFTGPEHVLHFVNRDFERLVHHRDLLGRPLREAFAGIGLRVPVEQLDRVYERGESFEGREHAFLFDRSGQGRQEECFFNYTYQPFKHFDGRIAGVVMCLLDVTDWVRAREQAEQRAAILEAVLQSIPDGICIADASGTIRVNPMARESLGEERVKALNLESGAEQALHDGFTQGDVLRRALGGEASTHVMYMRHAVTGEFRYVRSAAVPVRLRDKLVAAVSIHTDITEHLRVEAEREALLASEQAARSEAERANRLKDQFLARISHELATPLLGTRLWLDLLQSDERRRDEAIAALRQSTQAQSNLVSDLLDTARALSGKLTVSMEACEPGEPLQAAVAALRPLAEQKGVTLELCLQETSLIQADPERLRQVVSNLLTNAVKFTPPGGRVEVRLEEAEEGVCITVRDTGRGFPSQFSPLLFVPFRQEEEGTTRIHGGLGLGLAIARQLVELHGGRVWAESPGRDLGATFCVWLPRLEEDLSPVEGADAAAPRRQLVGVRLLLVEDDALTRAAVASVLEQHGADVWAVDSAAAALELLRHTPMDVMLCDIAMPREDGYSLIRKVRALAPPANHLPAAAFTAHMREEDRARSLAAGFQLHISKSVEAAQLIAQVSQLLRDTRS